MEDAPKVTEAEQEKGKNGKKKRRKKTSWELQVLDPAVGQFRDLVLSFPTYQKELFSNALSALRALQGLCDPGSSSSSEVCACLLCPLQLRKNFLAGKNL